MNRQEAKAYINSHPEYILERDKSGKGFVCPFCGNGSGSDGDGLRVNPKAEGLHLKCFKCGFYGDVIEIIARQYDMQADIRSAFEKARELYNIEIDSSPDRPIRETLTMRRMLSKPKDNGAESEELMQKAREQAEKYLRNCFSNIEGGLQYLESRGISKGTISRFNVGYDADRKAIVFATSVYPGGMGYVLRFIGADMHTRYQNAKGLSPGLFNARCMLQAEKPVFVVEGAMDALSIAECGYNAVALNSTNNADMFLKVVQHSDKSPLFILCMDNDAAGQDARERLANGLKTLSKAFVVSTCTNGYKDANEALQGNLEGFKQALEKDVGGQHGND